MFRQHSTAGIRSLVLGIDEKLIEEVLGLDLFDHDGVTYKVADLGNACWVERRVGPVGTYCGPFAVSSIKAEPYNNTC